MKKVEQWLMKRFKNKISEKEIHEIVRTALGKVLGRPVHHEKDSLGRSIDALGRLMKQEKDHNGNEVKVKKQSLSTDENFTLLLAICIKLAKEKIRYARRTG